MQKVMRFCLQKAFPNLFGCYDFFLGEGDVCLLASQVVLFGFRLVFYCSKGALGTTLSDGKWW